MLGPRCDLVVEGDESRRTRVLKMCSNCMVEFLILLCYTILYLHDDAVFITLYCLNNHEFAYAKY